MYEPDPAKASQVEARFTAESPAMTRVEFAHRHLENYGDGTERMRSAVDAPGGATQVLAAYAAAMAAQPAMD